MKALYLLITVLLIGAQTDAQTDTSNKVFSYVEQMPEFPGGTKALMGFISQKITYPEYERDSNIEGKVLLKFIVDVDGSVADVQVIKSVSPGIDNEAVRVVKLLPKFTPGYQQGKPVKVYFNLPISFKLTEPDTPAAKANPYAGRVYTFVEKNPQFPGGDVKLMDFLQRNVHYPKDAADKGIGGRVLLRFVVNEDGSISDVDVVKSVFPSLDKEAVRVTKLLPKFIPGMQQGHLVKVYFNLPIVFN